MNVVVASSYIRADESPTSLSPHISVTTSSLHRSSFRVLLVFALHLVLPDVARISIFFGEYEDVLAFRVLLLLLLEGNNLRQRRNSSRFSNITKAGTITETLNLPYE